MKTKFSGILTLLLAFVVQFTFAQGKTISGTVSDENGLPLPTATIIIQGTTTGTSTDFDGNYSIAASQGDVLIFSYVGYANQNQTVGASNKIDVSLQPDNTLDEVVVTAMGIKRKRDEITTANQVVKSEQLTQANNPDIIQGLSGKVSGLQINTTSVGVNSDTRIVLRGVRSITGNNQALVVIDGVISTANFLKSINPNSIESVNVIKGANGAALYGSDGSNGVIIVTTRKGSDSASKFTVDFKSSADFESISYTPDRQTRYGQGWSDPDQGFTNFTYENGGWGPEFDGSPATIGLPQADGTYVVAPYSSLGADNIEGFFKTGLTLQNQVSLSAGDADGYINISAQKQQTDFIIEGDELSKSTFNFKGGRTLGKWGVSGNATYSSAKTKEASSDLYGELLQTATNIPIEQFENSGNEGHWNGYYFNPYWMRDNNREDSRVERINLLTDLTYAFNDNISAVLRPNVRITNSNSLSHEAFYEDPASVVAITGNTNRNQQSSFRRQKSTWRDYYTDFLVNFDYELSEDFTLKANLGLNNQYNYYDYSTIGGSNLTIPGLYTSSNLSSGFDDTITYDNHTFKRKYGAFANLDIGFKDYLFLNATARNDWTSVLSEENNSFFYPSVGLSFIPTKAISGLKSDVLSYLKVSASFVKVGNDGGIEPYEINPTFTQAGGFPYGTINSFVVNPETVDPNIKPEFTESVEFGLNAEFFKRRITLDASVFSTTTTDLITAIAPSLTSGLSGSTINIGQMDSKGFEIDLGVKVLKSDDWNWDVNMSYSTNESTVVKVSDQADEVFVGGYTDARLAGIYAVEGEQFPTIKGAAYIRDDQGRVIINAATGTPEVSVEPQILGHSNPDYILGLNTKLRYKNLTLSGTFDYRTGHQFYSQTKYDMTWPGHIVETGDNRGAFLFPNSSIEDPSNPGQYIANTSVTSANTPAELTQFYSTYVASVGENNVLDATAFKVRELSLRYDLGQKMLDKTPISAVSFSVIGRNLFTVLPKENRGYADPESNFTTGNAQGISSTGQYPVTQSIGMSLNVTF
ncbi:SusC/RagA family TonB-linked outer membrane protein [Lacinutrix sp. WUR7]|uniref:SusC/RagA family TonB-linked outer membrane protein n=1 Tax=Lacinutrix sp. WUR7 TaxID=2653681 RepID=UPI00193E92AF|nr:SusC/RagA family TonB-linked outer membrane protein [Lacinutrix sp. WUR7]QRM88037.1 SusC/RagA family TonB-linked outer membrane protein [Lacinutrix sp. WUR7]